MIEEVEVEVWLLINGWGIGFKRSVKNNLGLIA